MPLFDADTNSLYFITHSDYSSDNEYQTICCDYNYHDLTTPGIRIRPTRISSRRGVQELFWSWLFALRFLFGCYSGSSNKLCPIDSSIYRSPCYRYDDCDDHRNHIQNWTADCSGGNRDTRGVRGR